MNISIPFTTATATDPHIDLTIRLLTSNQNFYGEPKKVISLGSTKFTWDIHEDVLLVGVQVTGNVKGRRIVKRTPWSEKMPIYANRGDQVNVNYTIKEKA